MRTVSEHVETWGRDEGTIYFGIHDDSSGYIVDVYGAQRTPINADCFAGFEPTQCLVCGVPASMLHSWWGMQRTGSHTSTPLPRIQFDRFIKHVFLVIS